MGLELVSIHIRKCGGISLRNSLLRVYGSALAVQYPGLVEEPVQAHTRAIHGHIQASIYHERYPEAALITWLRRPIDRFVSRYFYIKYHFGSLPERPANALFNRIIDGAALFRDFLEEAPAHERTSWYLAGVPLSRFRFVGIMEHFEEDLLSLAAVFGWQGDYSLVHWNKTVEFVERHKPEDLAAYRHYRPSADDIAFFNRCYAEENEIYQEALRVRAKRGAVL